MRKRSIPILLAFSAAAIVSLVLAGISSATARVTAPPVINVTALDFKYKLSKTAIPAGKLVTFKVTNKGKTAHDFDINGSKGTPYLAPGKSFTFKVKLKKGSWGFVCTVPRHAELGMRGNLTAK
jgi:uncharacterized cupredoxin-like copper-binding protein